MKGAAVSTCLINKKNIIQSVLRFLRYVLNIHRERVIFHNHKLFLIRKFDSIVRSLKIEGCAN